MDNGRIIMLGTGEATATRCYNTCFVVEAGGARLLVDAGGGNGILTQLEKARVGINDIHDMFVTHAHTDHVLGAVWVVRMIAHRIIDGLYDGIFNVYGHDKVLGVLDWICRNTLPGPYLACLGNTIFLHELRDGDGFCVGNIGVEVFDVHSTKEKQFGFRAILPGGVSLVCLGDEPYNDTEGKYAEGADWLMAEAFCLYADRERFRPYAKCHSTALDAGKSAGRLNVKNLVVYHTEDTNLLERKARYTEEVRRNFNGTVYVPDDLEVIDIVG